MPFLFVYPGWVSISTLRESGFSGFFLVVGLGLKEILGSGLWLLRSRIICSFILNLKGL